MSKKLKVYQVMVTVVLDTEVEVKAESLEKALEEGRKIGVRDVVEFDGGFNDGSVTVRGVFE